MAGEQLFQDHVMLLFADKLRNDESFCIKFWSALANVEWFHIGNGYRVSYSFRAAGGLISYTRSSGSYMD
jgi:hypothetical protein